ncbi:hypothetical protein [Thioclava kandeliae]|uniref:Uncharacterized protein n=1 Tax=Thioclava kandeliae TaxID=3070818 RepID=A0ABV1SFE2_9RHOB
MTHHTEITGKSIAELAAGAFGTSRHFGDETEALIAAHIQAVVGKQKRVKFEQSGSKPGGAKKADPNSIKGRVLRLLGRRDELSVPDAATAVGVPYGSAMVTLRDAAVADLAERIRTERDGLRRFGVYRITDDGRAEVTRIYGEAK